MGHHESPAVEAVNTGPAHTGSRTRWLEATLLVAAILIVAGPGLTQGGLGWSDAPQHVGNGIAILEFLKQLPLDDARGWFERFYLHYPAIGLVVYWPPGFGLIEAMVFALFGPSVVAARVTVMLFAFGAAWLMCSLGRRWFDDQTGLLAALLLITCPHGGTWLNDVMLEWPATFWILLVVWAYQKDRDHLKTRYAVATAVAAVMAFMTKQTAAFIWPIVIVHALLDQDRRRFLGRPAWIASMLAAAGIIGAYQFLASSYAALSPTLLQPSIDPWFYPQHLVEIVGLPLIPIIVLGPLTFILKPDRGPRGLLLLWLLAWTGFSMSISAKEPRYLFFALAPLMFAAVRFLMPLDRTPETRITRLNGAPRIALFGLIILTQVGLGLRRPGGRLPDYAAAADLLATRSDADLVLVDAVRDGQFVLDNYRNPRCRGRIIPLRASKLLYARAARMKYGGVSFVDSEDDIVELLDRYGIRYIVAESALPDTPYTDADPEPRRMLRRLLASHPAFEEIASWPLRCGNPAWDDVNLVVYHYRECPPRESNEITLSFPAMKRDITLSLDP